MAYSAHHCLDSTFSNPSPGNGTRPACTLYLLVPVGDMKMTRLIGSPFLKLVSLSMLSAWLYFCAIQRTQMPFHLFLIFTILTLLSFIFSFKLIYKRWMKFADFMHQVGPVILFSFCYCVIVPFFSLQSYLISLLRLAGGRKRSSFWRKKDAETYDMDYFKRMG